MTGKELDLRGQSGNVGETLFVKSLSPDMMCAKLGTKPKDIDLLPIEDVFKEVEIPAISACSDSVIPGREKRI